LNYVLEAGDGGAGGGISLAGAWWDKEALALAEQVSASFNDDLKIYAFKTAANLTIRVRIEKMSTRYYRFASICSSFPSLCMFMLACFEPENLIDACSGSICWCVGF
jgi:hypothetical protein